MIFQITMNMPSYGGSSVHQILGEHEAENLADFMEVLEDNNFVLVTEWYRNEDPNTPEHTQVVRKGEIVLQTNLCGKVKVFNSEERPRKERLPLSRRA